MTDDKFLQIEAAVLDSLIEFKKACDEVDLDFSERVKDLIYRAEEE